MSRPLCFVLVPYHSTVEDGQNIDFPAVYEQLIAPAILDAGMTPLRADEDPSSQGIFQKSMFERLVVCEYAVADLSSGNPNVYYELGVRHALRPHSTVLLFREGWRLPLDVAHGSALAYPLHADGRPAELTRVRARLVERLRNARNAQVDSPVHQLVLGLPVADVDHARIDSFRDHADRDERLRHRLDAAVCGGREEVLAVEREQGRPEDLDVRTALSLLLAYRSTSAWGDVVRLVRSLPQSIARVELVRQMYAWALNRCGEDGEAERILVDLARQRPSSETQGLIGRVYKDRWDRTPPSRLRNGLLERAIEAYLKGFEIDHRDPYPGINALVLMFSAQPCDPRFTDLLPVVAYAARRRLTSNEREPDYWDHATDLVLAVLAGDEPRAEKALARACALVRDEFEPSTTARDLHWIAQARRLRGDDERWVGDLAAELEAVTAH